jgi:hypothetical protein
MRPVRRRETSPHTRPPLVGAYTQRNRLTMGPLAAVALVLAAVHHADGAFMAKLPLRVLSVLPSSQQPAGSAGPAVAISGREALTVTFSRAVIALGADFGLEDQPLPGSMTPFTLSPSNIPVSTTARTPGRLKHSAAQHACTAENSSTPARLRALLGVHDGRATCAGSPPSQRGSTQASTGPPTSLSPSH